MSETLAATIKPAEGIRLARLKLLGRCLSLDEAAQSPEALRDEIAATGWDTLLGLTDELRLTSVLVEAVAAKGLAPAIPKMTLPDGRLTVTAALALRHEDHVASRDAFSRCLEELVVELNARGIVPILIKGARSLWLGAPRWRSLRDIDLLVPGRQAGLAQEIAIGLGYAEPIEPTERKAHHHLANLYRFDLPGWIEIHRRGGVPRAEQFMRTAELDAAAVAVPGRGTARLLPAHLHILHAMVHHHVGHRGDKYGTIDLKGLYEFAAECGALDAAGRELLLARAARHPRLLAITELWIAAARDFFGMPVEAPLAVRADAMEWWTHIRKRLDLTFGQLDRHGGVDDELAAARRPERLRRAPFGNTAIGRQFWRLAIAASFIQRVAIG